MEWLLRRKFLTLLLALAFLIVVDPVLHDTPVGLLTFNLLFTAALLASLQVVFRPRRNRVLALLLGLPTLVGAWTGYALPDLPQRPLAVVLHSFAALFFGFLITRILGVVYKERGVS